MIRSFVFSEGKLVGENIDTDALRLVRADKGLFIWLDLFQPTQDEIRESLENLFAFHPLAIEDCLAVSSLPKIEDYEDYLFVVMHAVDFSRKEQFQTSELDLFLGKEFLVTHHTVPLRSVDSTIDRVQKNAPSVAKGMDRLAHSLLDAMVDNYQPVLAELTAEIGKMEDEIFMARPNSKMMGEFLQIKNEVAKLRQIIRPQKEVMGRLASGDYKMIRTHLRPYYRDIHDNLLRLDDAAANFSDRLFLALDVYLNRTSMETNEIIKVLTMLTALTTPLMIVGTWYGMNFEDMPELHHAHGYQTAWVVTILSTVGLLAFLKFKKWI